MIRKFLPFNFIFITNLRNLIQNRYTTELEDCVYKEGSLNIMIREQTSFIQLCLT